jgi:hypothetical protein
MPEPTRSARQDSGKQHDGASHNLLCSPDTDPPHGRTLALSRQDLLQQQDHRAITSASTILVSEPPGWLDTAREATTPVARPEPPGRRGIMVFHCGGPSSGTTIAAEMA